MFNFALGFIAGAAVAVAYPPVFRFVAEKIAQIKGKMDK